MAATMHLLPLYNLLNKENAAVAMWFLAKHHSSQEFMFFDVFRVEITWALDDAARLAAVAIVLTLAIPMATDVQSNNFFLPKIPEVCWGFEIFFKRQVRPKEFVRRTAAASSLPSHTMVVVPPL